MDAASESDPEWATYLRTAAALGARHGEVCALRWSMVDLERGVVAIHHAIVLGEAGVVDREYPKNASSRRRVAIDEGTVQALASHRQAQDERALACGTQLVPDACVSSAEADGSQPWRPQVVTHRFRRLCRRLVLADGIGVNNADCRPGCRRALYRPALPWNISTHRDSGEVLGGGPPSSFVLPAAPADGALG